MRDAAAAGALASLRDSEENEAYPWHACREIVNAINRCVLHAPHKHT